MLDPTFEKALIAFACLVFAALLPTLWWFKHRMAAHDERNQTKDMILNLIKENNIDGVVYVAEKYGWFSREIGLLKPYYDEEFPLDPYTLGYIYGYLNNTPMLNLSVSPGSASISFRRWSQYPDGVDRVVQEIMTWCTEDRDSFLCGTDAFEKNNADGASLFRSSFSANSLIVAPSFTERSKPVLMACGE